jgi:hypothetical protein
MKIIKWWKNLDKVDKSNILVVILGILIATLFIIIGTRTISN